jgi:hypothetical protein
MAGRFPLGTSPPVKTECGGMGLNMSEFVQLYIFTFYSTFHMYAETFFCAAIMNACDSSSLILVVGLYFPYFLITLPPLSPPLWFCSSHKQFLSSHSHIALLF